MSCAILLHSLHRHHDGRERNRSRMIVGERWSDNDGRIEYKRASSKKKKKMLSNDLLTELLNFSPQLIIFEGLHSAFHRMWFLKQIHSQSIGQPGTRRYLPKELLKGIGF